MSLSEAGVSAPLSSTAQSEMVCRYRARVIRQLLEAALFEGLLPYHFDGNWFRFNGKTLSYCARGNLSGFGRVRLIQEQIWQCHASELYPVDLAELVAALPGQAKARQRLLQELQQTIAFCRWNQDNLVSAEDRRGLDYVALESAIHEGHPYHPCFKARTGFSFNDHAQYGPEAANRFQLCWLAVRRSLLAMRLDCHDEQAFWQRELGSECWQQLCDAMDTQGIGSEEYTWLPIHPWQLARLHTSLAPAIAERHVLLLGKAGDEYQASISLRTLLNVSHPEKANIKVPLNVVNSSSLRTIEPHSVCTAPLLSQWLHTVIAQDPWFAEHSALLIQREYAAMVLQDDNRVNPDANTDHPWLKMLAPSLSVIFRDSIATVADGFTATPFVALCLTEADGDAFIAPWLHQYGIETWLRRLLEVVVWPVWHLLVRHGIALETHGQNMTLLHHNGWPQKLVLRDFHESLEFVSEFLAAPELQPDFATLHPDYEHAEADRFYWMSSVEALRELLVDTLFVYNLSELAQLLELQFDYPETQFWQQVDAALQGYAATAHNWSERLARIDVSRPKIRTESLLRKKLSGQSDREFHHTIPNPVQPIRGGV